MSITEHSRQLVDETARKSEIEITPEMIEAGIQALKREPLLDCSYDQAWDLAEDVIRCALATSPKGTLLTAS